MNAIAGILKMTVRVLQEEGPGGLKARVGERVRRGRLHVHLFVFGCTGSQETAALPATIDLEVKRITLDDGDEIDELTRIDEWKIPRWVTEEKLREGWFCYAAKHMGRIVASAWTILNDGFEDVYMMRTFTLGPDEVYYWRVYCVAEFRGKAIVPYLLHRIRLDMAHHYGRTNVLVLSRTTNKQMLNVYKKTGWECVGRAGFIEVFGLRFHYLLGRHAFPGTRKRFFVQNVV